MNFHGETQGSLCFSDVTTIVKSNEVSLFGAQGPSKALKKYWFYKVREPRVQPDPKDRPEAREEESEVERANPAEQLEEVRREREEAQGFLREPEKRYGRQTTRKAKMPYKKVKT